MTAGISRETWDKSVERYMQAPYCQYEKQRGDEVLFLSNYITAVRLSDESTYLIHPLYMMQFGTTKIAVELTENAVKEYEDAIVFKDSNSLALINDNLMHIFEDQRYVVSDVEKLKRVDALVAVAKEKFYTRLKNAYQTTASPLPKPHPSADKVKQYMARPVF